MRIVFVEIVLRCSFASIIGGRDIGDQHPAVQRINIACEYTPREREHYDFMCNDQSTILFQEQGINDGNDAFAWETTMYCKLRLITFVIGVALPRYIGFDNRT
jgi:hypothetical protein